MGCRKKSKYVCIRVAEKQKEKEREEWRELCEETERDEWRKEEKPHSEMEAPKMKDITKLTLALSQISLLSPPFSLFFLHLPTMSAHKLELGISKLFFMSD